MRSLFSRMTAQLRKGTLKAPMLLDKDEVHELGDDKSFDKEDDVEQKIRKNGKVIIDKLESSSHDFSAGDWIAVDDGPSWLPAELLQTTKDSLYVNLLQKNGRKLLQTSTRSTQEFGFY
ncbi:unnamed protein product [Didymodactylos carnosus]|uniref:Uncharacterized protein n=1 Tax=Didymodactylos carnosus TaxID=1234261 RepID=A0A814W0S8_9BILA|nr:unnamed protein product [Didymodactylos carnosus]CAF3959028.1 unnamed protein product [Didymodactylos carnosus]